MKMPRWGCPGVWCTSPEIVRRFQADDMHEKQKSGGAFDADTLFDKECLEFAGLEHFADYIAAADEFAFDVELRDRRPVGVFLDALAQFGRVQNVHAFIVGADIVEDLDHLAGKSALRETGR